MQHKRYSIAPALLDEIDKQEEGVEELFPDDDHVDELKGLMESKREEEPISPEDLAWVDSCLVTDPEFSMENWISLKEALLDTITAFATSFEENNVAAIGEDETRNGEHIDLGGERNFVNGEGDSDHIQVTGIGVDVANNGEHMELGEEQTIVINGGAAPIRAKANTTGGGHDSDCDGEVEIIDTKKEFESRESIFKVWDLRDDEDDVLIPELQRAVADLRMVEKDEDHFITELNRAVAESIIREKRMLATDEKAIAEDRKLDQLISSMGDLSIKQMFP